MTNTAVKNLRGVTEGKAERRQSLINATHTAIAQYGLSNTTLAKVAKIAGLVAGTVNFHFNGKDELMVEALKTLTDSFGEGLEQAVLCANNDPIIALNNIIDIYFDPVLSSYDRMVAWNTFSAASHAHGNFHDVCSAADQRYSKVILDTTQQIIALGNKQESIHAEAVTLAIVGLLDQAWQSMIDNDTAAQRKQLQQLCLAFFASIFPWAYQLPG